MNTDSIVLDNELKAIWKRLLFLETLVEVRLPTKISALEDRAVVIEDRVSDYDRILSDQHLRIIELEGALKK